MMEDNKFKDLTIEELKVLRVRNLVELKDNLNDFSLLWSIALNSSTVESNKQTVQTLQEWMNNSDPVRGLVILSMIMEVNIEIGMSHLAFDGSNLSDNKE